MVSPKNRYQLNMNTVLLYSIGGIYWYGYNITYNIMSKHSSPFCLLQPFRRCSCRQFVYVLEELVCKYLQIICKTLVANQRFRINLEIRQRPFDMLVGRQSNPSPEFLFSNRIYSSHAATFTTLLRRTPNKTAIFHEICYCGVIIRT